MTEPRIQYAKTSDGVSIAYWSAGDGLPFVHLSPGFPFTNLQLEWMVPGWEEWCSGLASVSRLVRFDPRGCGLSGGAVGDLSIDGLVQDLGAVADRLALDQFVLAGVCHTGPAAIAYAARNPARVSRLILWCTYARASQARSPQAEALHALLDKDWVVFTETFAHVLFGWSESEALQFGSFAREALDQADARSAFESINHFDVSDFLPKVTSPTLVVHRRHFPISNVEVAKDLASSIPNARLAILDGASLAPWIGDADLARRSVIEFLLEQQRERQATEELAAGPLRTMFFTDVEGSTALTDRLGDTRARELLREYERIVREALKAHGGSEVKALGDGFMASFSSATRALECAIAIQRALAERNESAEVPVLVRVGLNAGEPIAEDEDLFGASVNRAARIAAMAQGGEILAANVVRELAEGKGFLFGDRGETALRGFDDPVRLFEVRWRDG